MTTTEAIPNSPESPTPPELPELETLSFSEAIETLLKRPLELVAHFQRGEGARIGWSLLICSVICLGIFGTIVGLFSLGAEHSQQQLWAAPAKITGGVLFSALICLPSLYIFGLLTGMDLKIGTATLLLICMVAVMSLLLIGFAPVVWIFAQSTNSLPFMSFLLLVFWSIALYFGIGLILKVSKLFSSKPKGHLMIWVMIFIVVTLQMSTSLRPIIGTSEDLLPQEKKFFLQHWGEVLSDEMDPTYR